MKRMTLLALGLAGLGIGFAASAAERDFIQEIADEAGVTPRRAQMVLGDRTAFSEYRVTYDRIEPRVREAAARVLARHDAEDTRAIAIAKAEAHPAKPLALATR